MRTSIQASPFYSDSVFPPAAHLIGFPSDSHGGKKAEKSENGQTPQTQKKPKKRKLRFVENLAGLNPRVLQKSAQKLRFKVIRVQASFFYAHIFSPLENASLNPLILTRRLHQQDLGRPPIWAVTSGRGRGLLLYLGTALVYWGEGDILLGGRVTPHRVGL